jgi:hypothetical protein
MERLPTFYGFSVGVRYSGIGGTLQFIVRGNTMILSLHPMI